MKLRKTLSLTVAGLMAIAGIAIAADHFDSPLANRDVRTDVTDVYAFRSPTNANNLVVAMNVSSHVPGAAPVPLFSQAARYNIHVDNTGDLLADAVVTVTFTGNTTQTFSVAGLGATPITGQVTPAGSAPIITTSGPIKIFVGPREDPFFFDLDGFKAFVAAPYIPAAGYRASGAGSPVDFFAGRNVGSIVIELPIVALTGAANANTGTIRAWTSITEPQTN
ncbi:MAG: DUF4331 family protein [candidate division Zixibacteria bacterium]|nr:DUF4331 family protein [candidate division Zixibacteria bacterium]